MKILTYIILLIIVPAVALGVNSQSSNTYMEISPLKSFWGQASLRFEKQFMDFYGWGINGEYLRYTGQRKDYLDQTRRLGVSLFIYGDRYDFPEIFAGAGMQWEKKEQGAIKIGDYRSNIQLDSEEMYDLWVEKGESVYLNQVIGYRFISDNLFTASISINFEEFLFGKSSYRVDRQVSSELEPGGLKPEKMRTFLSLFVGFLFH